MSDHPPLRAEGSGDAKRLITTPIDVNDVLILPNDDHWYRVKGMLFLGHPVTKLTIELEAIEQ